MSIQHIYLEEPKKKCRIGEACLSAIVAHSGFILVQGMQQDDYGNDFEVKKLARLGNNINDVGVHFRIQLKTSCNWSIENGEIVYDLEVKAYNSIVQHNQFGTTKQILVLMCLENRNNEWCCIDSESVKFRNSLFWFYTDSCDLSDNQATHRIRIPVTQIFNHAAIHELIERFDIFGGTNGQ